MKIKSVIVSSRGATLIELIVALFISTIVISGVYKLYQFVTVSTTREKQKSELQRDIIGVSSMLERDIRLAGCNLPGNGIFSLLDNTGDDKLTLHFNENRRETTLADTARLYNTRIRVADTAGFYVNGCVCLAAAGVDTLFKKITRIGVNNSGPDTLYLYTWLQAGPFPPATTHVFPATRITYQLTGSPVPKLYRVRDAVTLPVGSRIDSIKIIPKNTAGASIGSATDRAAVIMVLVGGHVGKDGNRVFIGDSTQVNLRN